MKISIKFEGGDNSDLKKVALRAGSGTADELACTFAVVVTATNFDFDAVVASMLQYTSEGYSPLLYKACEEWLESHKGVTE